MMLGICHFHTKSICSKNVYDKIKQKEQNQEELYEKRLIFKNNYEEITNNSKEVLPRSYWRKSFKTTFYYELDELITKSYERVFKTNQKISYFDFGETKF